MTPLQAYLDLIISANEGCRQARYAFDSEADARRFYEMTKSTGHVKHRQRSGAVVKVSLENEDIILP